MRALPQRLRTGVGFLMLRGLPRDRLSDDDMARIYFGLCCYAGRPMTQSYLGDLIGHVVDVSDLEPKSRGYRKGGGQLMHTDSCDIIGLMCLRTAKSGGDSRISSALTVHNWLLANRPDLLEVLAEGLYLKRTDEDGRRATRTYSEHKVPFFHGKDGEVTCYLPTGYARLAEKSGERPYTPAESRRSTRCAMPRALPSTTWTWGSRTAISSSSTTASWSTAAPTTRTTRNYRSAATCCGCGCASRRGRRCRPSRSFTPTRTCGCGAAGAAR